VLVVEDDAGPRDVLARGLREHGFEIMTAADGGTALRSTAQPLSAVVLDIGLPDADGRDVCRSGTRRAQTSRPRSRSRRVVTSCTSTGRPARRSASGFPVADPVSQAVFRFAAALCSAWPPPDPTRPGARPRERRSAKVPEVTIYVWLIKVPSPAPSSPAACS